MAQQQGKKNGSITKQIQAAWDAGRLDEAAELLRVLAKDLTDGYGRITEERAAKLALKPTKALKQLLTLCEGEETMTTFLTSPLALAQDHPTLAFNMSRLIASGSHFPKPTEMLVKCGALDFLAGFLSRLPPLIDRATRPPGDNTSLSVASNLIITANMLRKSQDGFSRQLLRAGALDGFLESAPFPVGRFDFSLAPGLARSTLDFVSPAVHLCWDLMFARRIQIGEGAELCSKIVDWSSNLLELVCDILEAPGWDDDALGDLPETCVNGILMLMHLVAQGSPGVFDFRPSIRRAAPHLVLFPEDRTQIRLVVEGLERASKADAAGGEPRFAELRVLVIPESSKHGFLTIGLMQQAFASCNVDVCIQAIVQLATFFHKRKSDPDYRQADLLHEQRSLFLLVPHFVALLEAVSRSDHLEDAGDFSATTLYVLSEVITTEVARQEELSVVPPEAEQLEKAGLWLLKWLKLHHSEVRSRLLLFAALTAVSQCARATWVSLAALLNAGGFLVFCKDWFEANAQRVTFEETEDFAQCILTALQVPRGEKVVAAQNVVKEVLTKDGMLTWVFELAGRVAGMKTDKRPNLLPLLALCSTLKIDVSAFLTPAVLHQFVRQLVHNWRCCLTATLPNFEEDDFMLRSMGEEFNRLAGHVRIVEAVLCGGRKDAGGNWHPGYLADLRVAVSEGIHTPSTATFMTFCEAEGVAVFASIMEGRERLERFRVRAEREGFLLPEAADVARRVEAVWELVASAFDLHKCANQACSRVEDQKGAFMRCGGCKIARYCTQGCQKAHWRAGHKQECRISR